MEQNKKNTTSAGYLPRPRQGEAPGQAGKAAAVAKAGANAGCGRPIAGEVWAVEAAEDEALRSGARDGGNHRAYAYYCQSTYEVNLWLFLIEYTRGGAPLCQADVLKSSCRCILQICIRPLLVLSDLLNQFAHLNQRDEKASCASLQRDDAHGRSRCCHAGLLVEVEERIEEASRAGGGQHG